MKNKFLHLILLTTAIVTTSPIFAMEDLDEHDPFKRKSLIKASEATPNEDFPKQLAELKRRRVEEVGLNSILMLDRPTISNSRKLEESSARLGKVSTEELPQCPPTNAPQSFEVENHLKQLWEVTYKQENDIYIPPKTYRFEEPNEHWTLSNHGGTSKLAKISYSLVHEVTEVLDVNTDHLSWDMCNDINLNTISEMARLPNGGYRTRMKVDSDISFLITFNLFPSFLDQENNWIQDVMAPSLKQLGISICKAKNYSTGLDFEIITSHPTKLIKLLNFFVEKDGLPQEKATEFWESTQKK